MSRIGRMPISIPKDVKVETDRGVITVTGTKGQLKMDISPQVKIEKSDTEITVSVKGNNPKIKAMHGFTRAYISNMIEGVTKGWIKTLELSGVGYRAALNGKTLVLTVGYSHPVNIEPPVGVDFSIVEGKINVSGIDKQQVGQVAANVRSVRKPEPYKGKGIRYQGEYIRKKAGKAKAVGATGGGK